MTLPTTGYAWQRATVQVVAGIPGVSACEGFEGGQVLLAGGGEGYPLPRPSKGITIWGLRQNILNCRRVREGSLSAPVPEAQTRSYMP